MKLTYAIIFTILSIGYFETRIQAQYSDVNLIKDLFPSAKKVNSIQALKQTIASSKEDTAKVDLLVQLSNIYMWLLPDTSLTYALQALKLSYKLNFNEGIIKVYHSMGSALSIKGNHVQALEIQLKGLRLAEKIKDEKEIALSYMYLGSVYIYSGDFQNALNYFLKSSLYKNVFAINAELIYDQMGKCYLQLKKFDSAVLYVQRSIDLEKQANNDWIVPLYYDMGAIYAQTGNYIQSVNYYRKGINSAAVVLDLIYGYNGIAIVFEKSGMIDSSILYAKKAVAVSQKASLPFGIIQGGELLTGMYKSRHLTDSAFKYQEILNNAKDSLISEEKVKHLQDLTFNEQLRQQEIAVEKNEYQNKLWIITLLIAAVFAIAYLILYIRKKQALQVMHIRNRIARDLHDDVGSALSSIAVFSDVINKNLKTGDEQTSSLAERIGDNARQVIESMSDIIWAVKPSNETVAEMLIRMKQLCSNLFESKEIAFQFEADEKVSLVKLPMNYRRDMYLIFKEAINNIVKYSACKNVVIKLFAKDSLFQLVISDDGIGFDTTIAINGNGLQNMKARATVMGGSVAIESELNKGTIIQLVVPIP